MTAILSVLKLTWAALMWVSDATAIVQAVAYIKGLFSKKRKG